MAWPRFRQMFHNRFEASHRFLGWTATALVWVQVVSLINDYRLPGESLGQAVVQAAPFWLAVVLTASIILPWLHLRKVPVKSVVLSKHAVRLYFDYGTPLSHKPVHSLTRFYSDACPRQLHAHLRQPAHRMAWFCYRARTGEEGLLACRFTCRRLDVEAD